MPGMSRRRYGYGARVEMADSFNMLGLVEEWRHVDDGGRSSIWLVVRVVEVRRQRRTWRQEDLRRDLPWRRSVSRGALPLSDEAVVPISVFSDQVGLDTKEFVEWCFEE